MTWRARPGAASYTVTAGVTLLAMLLTSKLAFFNYDVLVGACFLLGAAMFAGDSRVEGGETVGRTSDSDDEVGPLISDKGVAERT